MNKDSITIQVNMQPVGILAEAFMKQIPQPPLCPKMGERYCPTCNNRVDEDGKVFVYCKYCGQRLDIF